MNLKILRRDETLTLARLLQKLESFVSIVPMTSECKSCAWGLSLLIPLVREKEKWVLFSIDDHFYKKERWHLPVQSGNCNIPNFEEMCQKSAVKLIGPYTTLKFKGIISTLIYEQGSPLVVTALCEAREVVETNTTRFFPISRPPRPLIQTDEELIKRL